MPYRKATIDSTWALRHPLNPSCAGGLRHACGKNTVPAPLTKRSSFLERRLHATLGEVEAPLGLALYFQNGRELRVGGARCLDQRLPYKGAFVPRTTSVRAQEGARAAQRSWDAAHKELQIPWQQWFMIMDKGGVVVPEYSTAMHLGQ